MKKLLLAGVAVSALMGIQSGYTADLSRPALKAPAPVPVYSWTGCYVGGQVGWGWQRNKISQNGQTTRGVSDAADLVFNSRSNGNVDSHGGVFGGQVGCDYQFSNWVVGVQGMGLGTNITGLGQDPHNGAVGPFGGGVASGGSIATRTNYLASATVRLGITGWSPQTLVYVKGGGAWTEVQYDLRHAALNYFTDPSSAIFTNRHSGWTIGGGFEWMFATNWSAFVEYNYYDFKSQLIALVDQGAGEVNRIDSRPQISTVTVGVNYRFNWATPVQARY